MSPLARRNSKLGKLRLFNITNITTLDQGHQYCYEWEETNTDYNHAKSEIVFLKQYPGKNIKDSVGSGNMSIISLEYMPKSKIAL